ncbi:hypothetical protein B0H17DRAFT_1149791 [Mycena rosella]|uniref:Uncharacterized protein n=1 Tax=Mycena rosella TaxID=1033263 RepID=A0AAD7FRD8_MYCRO|nr:hypothetical protein B0H17DRAFT_1149791 [Mycena rosella]
MRRAGTHPPPRCGKLSGRVPEFQGQLSRTGRHVQRDHPLVVAYDLPSAVLQWPMNEWGKSFFGVAALSVDNGTNTQGPNAAGTEANFDIQYAMSAIHALRVGTYAAVLEIIRCPGAGCQCAGQHQICARRAENEDEARRRGHSPSALSAMRAYRFHVSAPQQNKEVK